VALGLLLAVVVLFMPDGIIPAFSHLLARFRPQASSIREVTQAELLEDRRAQTSPEGQTEARAGRSATRQEVSR
jgi:branched-chain amino acid transport system permease protein